jgi:hypothetical protein
MGHHRVHLDHHRVHSDHHHDLSIDSDLSGSTDRPRNCPEARSERRAEVSGKTVVLKVDHGCCQADYQTEASLQVAYAEEEYDVPYVT